MSVMVDELKFVWDRDDPTRFELEIDESVAVSFTARSARTLAAGLLEMARRIDPDNLMPGEDPLTRAV